MHDGQWETAESLFSNALEVSKADDRAHGGLAEAYWKRGERDLAITHMEQAVRLSAGDVKFVLRLGRMYLDLGRLGEANKHSQWALELARDSPAAWALRGDCSEAAGNKEDALVAYHRALALQPDNPEVQIKAAEIYRSQNRYDRLLATVDRLQDGTGIDDSPPRVDILRGIAMRRLGRPEEAAHCFARASDKDPSDAAPFLELASLALELGNADSARKALEAAARLDPEAAADGELTAALQQQRLARESTSDDAARRR